jgi:hypothetical protein
MRISILWKLLVPIVLVVSVLAVGLLWVQLRLLDESFRRRAVGQMAVGTEVVQAEQQDLEEQTLLVARNLSRDGLLMRALLAHDQHGAAVDLALVASSAGVPTLAVFDAHGRLFAATWPVQQDNIPPQIAGLMPQALAGRSVAGPVPSWRLPGQVAIVAIAPIRGSTRIDGVVIVEAPVGNAFVDGVKHLTGLDMGVFLGDLRVVSTNFSKDGHRIVNQRAPSRNAHRVLGDANSSPGTSRFGLPRVPLSAWLVWERLSIKSP